MCGGGGCVCGFCKQAGRPKHNSRSPNALHGPRRAAADPEALQIRGALVLARVRVPPNCSHLACPLHGLRAANARTDRGVDMGCSRV